MSFFKKHFILTSFLVMIIFFIVAIGTEKMGLWDIDNTTQKNIFMYIWFGVLAIVAGFIMKNSKKKA